MQTERMRAALITQTLWDCWESWKCILSCKTRGGLRHAVSKVSRIVRQFSSQRHVRWGQIGTKTLRISIVLTFFQLECYALGSDEIARPKLWTEKYSSIRSQPPISKTQSMRLRI